MQATVLGGGAYFSVRIFTPGRPVRAGSAVTSFRKV